MPQDQDDIKGADAIKQAPTPGPLTAESVKLLVKGDLLRIDGGALYEFVRRKSSPSVLIVAKPAVGGSERYYDGSRFLFVERPSLAPPAPVERPSLAPTAPVEASGSEREALDSAASAFIATSFGFSGPNDQDTPLQAAAREVGWMLSEVVDRIEWNKRGQAANALGRLATSIDGLVWPWEGDDPRHDQIRDAWRSYADNSADDDGRIDLTEVETCVAIGCMKAMQLLSPDLRPHPSGFLETLTDEQRTAALAHIGGDTHPQPSGETREIARWDICNGGVTEDFEVHADPTGEWVKYADVEALLSARPAPVAETAGEAVEGLYTFKLPGDLTISDIIGHLVRRVAKAGDATNINVSTKFLRVLLNHVEATPPVPAQDDDKLRTLADRVTAEVKRGADGSHVQALGALSNIEGLVLAALKSTAAQEGGLK